MLTLPYNSLNSQYIAVIDIRPGHTLNNKYYASDV